MVDLMGRRSSHAQANIMRNKLQIVARELVRKVYVIKGNDNRTVSSVWQLVGEIEGYLATRKSLLPEVAADGYMQQLNGYMQMLKRLV